MSVASGGGNLLIYTDTIFYDDSNCTLLRHIVAAHWHNLEQMPLLSLFGSLSREDYLQVLRVRSGTSYSDSKETSNILRAAAARARSSLRQCVIANTDDMHASSQLVAHHFPWLGRALAADSVPHANTRDVQRHPSVVLPNGKWSHRDCQWHFNFKLKDHGALVPSSH